MRELKYAGRLLITPSSDPDDGWLVSNGKWTVVVRDLRMYVVTAVSKLEGRNGWLECLGILSVNEKGEAEILSPPLDRVENVVPFEAK